MRDTLYCTGGAVMFLGVVGAFLTLHAAADCRVGELCMFLREIRIEAAISALISAWLTGIFFIALGYITRLLEDIRAHGLQPQATKRDPVMAGGPDRLSTRPTTFTPTRRDPGGV